MACSLMKNKGVATSVSDRPPTHYTVKIQFFSLLTKNSIERYESGDFDAGGYKWKLIIYPNGNKKENVKDHISLYLAMAQGSWLRPGWEVYAAFRMFLLHQKRDNYLTHEDANMGNGRRFHESKLEWGFDRFVSLNKFNEPSNGYLIDDTCVFGAEVTICKENTSGKGECVSMIKEAIPYQHPWKIENFSKLEGKCHESSFFAGGQKWMIQLYPSGMGKGMGSHLSLFLALAQDKTLSPGFKLYAHFTLRLHHQNHGNHYEGKGKQWFGTGSSGTWDWGWPRFISLTQLNQLEEGFLLNDTCLVEADVTIQGVAFVAL